MGKRTGKTLLCRRYAVALFELATEKNIAKACGDELVALKELVQAIPELKAAIENPSLPAAGVAKAITVILQKSNASEYTQNFCVLLAENRRLSLLPGIVVLYQELLAESQNEVTAEVTSATPINAAQTKNIAAGLTRYTGKKITIVNHIDSSLLGGFTVKIGSQMLDGSLSGKLNRLEQFLKLAESN